MAYFNSMWNIIALFITVILIQAAAAQQADQRGTTDSLLQLLMKAREDTNRVHLLHLIADQYETSEPVKARYYVGLAGELSRKLNFEAGIFKYYRHLSFINAYQSQYDSVLFYNLLLTFLIIGANLLFQSMHQHREFLFQDHLCNAHSNIL